MTSQNEAKAMTLMLAAQALQIAAHHVLKGNYSYPVLSDSALEAGARALLESRVNSLLGEQAELVFMTMLGEMAHEVPNGGVSVRQNVRTDASDTAKP